MPLTTTSLTPRVGTEIRTDAATLLAGAAAEHIRRMLEERGVLVFPAIGFDDDQQIAFAKTLGAVREEGEKGIFKVTFDREQNPTHAEYLYGTLSWHMDRTDVDVPPLASILSPRILSPTGGETEFANTYAAYEDLPAPEKRFLEGLQVVHTLEASYREAVADPSDDQLRTWRNFAPKTHPLVWRHRSGRKSLVLSMSASNVVGMNTRESDTLLRRLMDWAAQPQYVYRHRWAIGDLLIWDNTGTMHRVLPYDRACGRRLHRVTLVGEEPIAAA